jgi:urease accessory protein
MRGDVRFDLRSLILATAVAFLPGGSALAHVPAADGAGLLAGLAHPLSGWDHVIAFLAVGIWAYQIGRAAQWVLPTIFVTAVVGGSVLGSLELPVQGVEQGIAISVLVLGIAIGAAFRPALAIGIPIIALFAIFHGHAHGAQLAGAASPALYGLGLILATASLHACGMALGWVAALPSGGMLHRIGGMAISLAGLYALLA